MKLRIRLDTDRSSYTVNRYFIEGQVSLTGTWIIQTPRTFSNRLEALDFIKERA